MDFILFADYIFKQLSLKYLLSIIVGGRVRHPHIAFKLPNEALIKRLQGFSSVFRFKDSKFKKLYVC